LIGIGEVGARVGVGLDFAIHDLRLEYSVHLI
jgi:hypothetical protein